MDINEYQKLSPQDFLLSLTDKNHQDYKEIIDHKLK
jgi:hypothetical protein